MYRKTFSAILFAVIIGSLPLLLLLSILTPEEDITLNQPPLQRFTSYSQLLDFLNRTKQTPYYYTPGIVGGTWTRTATFATLEDVGQTQTPDYSTTNIQVEGVDEADIIKTDGQYIYLASNNLIHIVKAYPPEEATLTSTIKLNGTALGLFINGNKLVVFTEQYPDVGYYSPECTVQLQVQIRIYDIENRNEPSLENEIALDGYYFTSRMIGNHIHLVTNHPAYIRDENVTLPTITVNQQTEKIEVTDIYYSDIEDYYQSFTTVISVDIETGKIVLETFLLGYSSSTYVSLNNIYVAIPKYENETQKTEVHRLHIGSGDITYQASGEVPGYILNQFSMDEYDGNFRIATTRGHVARTFEQAISTNNVYVLNQNLTIIGELEDLAPNERIYSARFMGKRCYLVTFKKVDPLFVISLENPERPEVLGKLKIPGYSDYLHPYDENHLIGIGKETVEAEEGDFAWYQGVKISLFDVSDVEKPKELAKYVIGDRGTDSPILRDHKALLFDKERNLLAIPVLVAQIDGEKYPQGVPPYVHGDYIWQGVYVFNITGNNITLRGGISHIDDESELLKSGYYFYSEYSVKRSLYIDDFIYTISDKKMKINNLTNLQVINEVELP